MRSNIFWLTAAMTAFIPAGVAHAVVELTLREQVTLESSVVRLGDVAEINANEDVRERLAALPLMPAPAPGTQRFLQRREVADLLAAHGVDLRELRVQGSEQIAITVKSSGWQQDRPARSTTAGVPVNRHAALLAGQIGPSIAPELEAGRAAELRRELDRLVAEYLNSKAGQAASWRVNCEVPDRQLALVASASSMHICQGGAPPWTGRQRFVACCTTPDGDVQLPIHAHVTATSQPVVVAVRPVGRGQTITAADVELRSIEGLPAGAGRRETVKSVEELIGMEARQAIRAGDVVYHDQAQPPIVVKRGEVITVSAQAGGIRVRTSARAREDGARGDLVQVESLETRERFTARVVGPREAAVFALTRAAVPEASERITTARQ